MTDVASLLLKFALGVGVDFSFLAWVLVTGLLVVVGSVFAQVSPRIVDPPARMAATRPERVAAWMGLSIVLTFVVTGIFVVSIIGAVPAPVIVPLWILLATLAGYVALGRGLGERLLVSAGMPVASVAPWMATAAGILVFRLVRVVPYVGAAAHSLICLFGYAAVSVVAWDAARSWHRRRMPDAEQFAGETLVEWYPEGDPKDGRPAVGTGAPVLGNIRGEEDRLPAAEDEDSASGGPMPPGYGR